MHGLREKDGESIKMDLSSFSPLRTEWFVLTIGIEEGVYRFVKCPPSLDRTQSITKGIIFRGNFENWNQMSNYTILLPLVQISQEENILLFIYFSQEETLISRIYIKIYIYIRVLISNSFDNEFFSSEKKMTFSWEQLEGKLFSPYWRLLRIKIDLSRHGGGEYFQTNLPPLCRDKAIKIDFYVYLQFILRSKSYFFLTPPIYTDRFEIIPEKYLQKLPMNFYDQLKKICVTVCLKAWNK